MCLLLFFILFWGWSVRVVRGLVRRQSADPVRGGGPRTGGQCFRVTPATMLTTGQSYEIKNLSVKNFNGKTHLGTTTETMFTPIDPLMEELKGEELLTNIKKTITVEEFKFTDKVNTFMVCQISNCKKKMPYAVDCKVITCASCGTCQKVKACEKGMSARLCAELDGKDIWLTAFTDVMKILINKVDLSCNNTTDELKQGLLNLENVELLIDSTSNFILDVLK